MTRRIACIVLLLFSATGALAQNSFTDSLYQFQQQYKKDLFEIIQADTAFVRFYTPDPAYRITARVKYLANESFFAMRTSDGKPKRARKFALVTFRLQGRSYQLFAYQLEFLLNSDEYRDNFFIPFLDRGSGESTYGGGRYLDFKTGDIVNSTLLIDFNKAYNPYCAFTTGYSCPVPPRENMLETFVKAGEKKFGKSKK